MWKLIKPCTLKHLLNRTHRPLKSRATLFLCSGYLKHLAAKKVVIRKAYATVPPTVEYSLSEIGKSLSLVIDSITNWGKYYAETMLGKSN